MDTAIEVRDLVVDRGRRRVLHGLSCAVPRGSVTGLLGPSGSGKTTFIRAVTGVQIIRSGTVRVLGEPAGSPSLRRRVGYVTQAPSVYPDLTVRENVRYFAALHGLSSAEAERAIADVGLASAATQLVGNLSGGQRSRASLACALIGRPEVLVLDEPTVGQDPVLRAELWARFHELAAAGTALLISSHVMDEARRCHRLLLIRDGRLIADDTPDGVRAAAGTDDLDEAFLRLVRAKESAGDIPANLEARRHSSQPGGSVMNVRILAATVGRILRQLRHDPRTVALLVVVPPLLMTVLYFMYEDQPVIFHRVALVMLGVFPFVIMFLVTSVAMLRERTTGTLERLLTTPMGKLDLLFGYGIAFGLAAAVQAAIATAVAYWLLDLRTAGSAGLVVTIAVIDAILGVALGLFCSAFARTEFQAVQFMPVVVIPQILLCGLFEPREKMAGWLQAISDVLPLTYAVDALQEVGAHTEPTGVMWRDMAVVAGAVVVALVLAAATLRRRSA